MINKIKLIGLLLVLVTQGCVRDGVDECPEGNVKLRFYAEKFQNRSQDPLSDREANFYERVNHIRYFLYKDDVLYKSDIVTVFDKTILDSYTLDFNNLEYGNYKIAMVANSTKSALAGDPALIDNLFITYPGSKNTEDYFSNVFSFTVDSTDSKEYQVGLLRLQGVIRYTFRNLPEDASNIEVIMENVAAEKWIAGDYKKIYRADLRYATIPVTRAVEGYVMATFPTVTNMRSRLDVNLYRTNEERAYVTQMVSDTLTVTRNQLLDVVLTYNSGQFDCEILLDTSWDGSSNGGQIGIQ